MEVRGSEGGGLGVCPHPRPSLWFSWHIPAVLLPSFCRGDSSSGGPAQPSPASLPAWGDPLDPRLAQVCVS